MLTLAYQTAEGLATKAMGAAACGRRRILGHKKTGDCSITSSNQLTLAAWTEQHVQSCFS